MPRYARNDGDLVILLKAKMYEHDLVPLLKVKIYFDFYNNAQIENRYSHIRLCEPTVVGAAIQFIL